MKKSLQFSTFVQFYSTSCSAKYWRDICTYLWSWNRFTDSEKDDGHESGGWLYLHGNNWRRYHMDALLLIDDVLCWRALVQFWQCFFHIIFQLLIVTRVRSPRLPVTSLSTFYDECKYLQRQKHNMDGETTVMSFHWHYQEKTICGHRTFLC